MKGALAVYGTTMVGMPAPAIVGRSLRVGSAASVVATKEPEVLVAVLSVAVLSVAEASVVVASVAVAVVSSEVAVDSAVVWALVEDSASVVWSSRFGRLSCALTIGAPARASSASSGV